MPRLWRARADSALEESGCENGRIDGRAEVRALRLLTAAALQELQLLASVDAFRRSAQPELAAHADDGIDDRGVALYHAHVLDEAAVDLDCMDRQDGQRAEGRVGAA